MYEAPSSQTERPAQENGSDSEDEEGEVADGDLSAVKPGFMEPCKLVLIVRTDLGMTPGKIAAQHTCQPFLIDAGKFRLLLHIRLPLTPTRHATLACYKALTKSNPNLLRHWERTGQVHFNTASLLSLTQPCRQAKIALKASSEDELLELEAIAKSLNLCARSIHDAGRTQIVAGSRTVLGIGPGPVELVNRVTGKLRLL
ncbi:putative peptidyl-tRNA hydrolase 2 [Grifola frondosa]|uniref:peptidyl-tRNA hydrolase n=1 Tax=Grifola frondosa TaxID=5627 RepID=A0A1C7MS38_GRIFR|nr:putative peptidyl-tRNA hydrolase 2 [Grifola frondosa]